MVNENGDNSSDATLQLVKGISNYTLNSPLRVQMEKHLLGDDRFRNLVDERWRPKPIEISDLLAMPEPSLGYQYAVHLTSHEIKPIWSIDPLPVNSTLEYIVNRLKEIHDLLHVLTGFGVYDYGEVGLHAFGLAQHRSPMGLKVVQNSIHSFLKYEQPIKPLLRSLSRGFQMGVDAELIIGFKLEEDFNCPLSDWRKVLKLPEVEMIL